MGIYMRTYITLYHKISFGKAFDMIKENPNLGMRLPSWSEDVVIRVQKPDKNSKMTAPYLYVQSRYGCVPWKETMIELFSNDWSVINLNFEREEPVKEKVMTEEKSKTTQKPQRSTVYGAKSIHDFVKDSGIIDDEKKNDKKKEKKDDCSTCKGCGDCSPECKKRCLRECEKDSIPSDQQLKDAYMLLRAFYDFF